MCNLRVLIIFGLQLHLQLPLGLKCLSNSIKVIEWSEYSLQSLPLGVKLDKLVKLKLHRSKIKQLWNGTQNFEKLKFIDLSNSKDLTHTPNFFGVPNLESLILEGCSNLIKIHESIGQLNKLIVLNLKGCINLKYLPSKLETKCLKDFNLCGCSKVQNPLEFVENLKENKSLERLDLSGTVIQEVPSSIAGFPNLKWFSIRGCCGQIDKPWWKFWGYSMPMGLKFPPLLGLEMLKELDARDCNLNGELIPGLNFLSSLEILRLSGNNLSKNSILMRWKFSQFSGLSKLKKLELNNCNLNDGSIPDDLSYLPSLRQISLGGNHFVNLPHGCISNLTCLRLLNLDSCSKLQMLPVFPSSLGQVDARNCGPMEPLSETQILKMMPIMFLSSVVIPGNEIPAWFNKQKDIPSDWKFQSYQDSIIVDIPDCCSNEWWDIVLCFIIETLDNANLSEGKPLALAVPVWSLTVKIATLNTTTQDDESRCSYPLVGKDFASLNRSHQFFLKLTTKHWHGRNRCQLFFRACHSIAKDASNLVPEEKLNISKCGWRVINKKEVWPKLPTACEAFISEDKIDSSQSKMRYNKEKLE